MTDKSVIVISFDKEERFEDLLEKVKILFEDDNTVKFYIAYQDVAKRILDEFDLDKLKIQDEQTRRLSRIKDVTAKDIETHTNEKGGSQSHIPVRFDLADGNAMFAMCAVLHEGAEKYGANNWRKIDIDAHLNHLIMHAYAYLAGDRTDEHLSHIMCRAMFAQGVDLQEDE